MLRRALPIYAAITAVFCWPLFAAPTGVGIMDWDQHFFLYAAVARSVVAFHQLPFWNPWYCGGNLLWQNPEVALLSPAYLLTLVMPLQLAMKFTIALHVLIGLIGMHVLLRRSFQLASLPLVVFLASVFACCGGLALHIGVGHATWLTFLYLPFTLHFLIQTVSTSSIRPALAAGGCLALSVYNGGIYSIVMAGVGFAVFGVVASIVRRDWRPLAFVALAGAAGFAYAAPKLVPIGAAYADVHLVEGRKGFDDTDSMNWSELVVTLINPTRPPDWGGWYEYGNYIGPLAGLLFAAGMLYWLWGLPLRERWLGVSLTAAAVLLLLLARGVYSDYAPYVWLRHLPVFSSMRKPMRYSFVFTLFAAAGVAEAIRAGLAAQSLSLPLRRLAAIVLVLATADVVWHNRAILDGVMADAPFNLDLKLSARTGPPAFDRQTAGDATSSTMMSGIADNRDIVNCHEVVGVMRATHQDDAIVAADRSVTLSNLRYSPNRIDVDVASRESARVFLNQNYMTGWHVSGARFAVDSATNRAVAVVPAGFRGQVTFYYRPAGLWVGFVLLAVALAFTAVTIRRARATPIARAERYASNP